MKLNKFTNENYILIENIFKIIFEYYKKVNLKGIDRNKNLIGFLFHDLMLFFSSYSYQKKLKKKNSTRFGFRNKQSLLIKHKKKRKFNFFYEIYLLITRFFFVKKIYFGYGVKLNLKQKIVLIFFSFVNGYQIKFIENLKQKVFFDQFAFQKKILQKLIRKLSIVCKLKKIEKKSLDRDLNSFLSKIISNYRNINEEDKILLIGSSANIFNRIAAASNLSKFSKNIVFGHENHTGFTNNLHLRFNEFQFADRYVCNGISDKKILKNYVNYYDLQGNFPNFIHRSKIKNKEKLSIAPLNKNIENLRGLYVPTRIETDVINSSECLNHKTYQKWQNYLLKSNNNIFIKPHPKQTLKIKKISKQKIIYGDLTKIIDYFDYLIFDFISSAAFGDVVSSNKQIVYFNIGLSSFTKVGKKLLNKRVHKIDINFDQNFNGFEKFSDFKLTRKNNEFSRYFCNSDDNYKFIKRIFK